MTNVTDSDCSICLEPLANKSVLATLYCGHVFHKECISKCTATRSTCPLCQKSIHRQNFPVIRLYLDNEATDTPNDTQQPDDKYEKLKASNLALRNKLDLLEEQYDQKDKRLEHVEKQWKADAKLMTKYKNIKEVLELDARLSADDRRNQIKLWQRLDKDDLCMVSASLYDRLSHVTA
ncbi:hypothetical protein BCR42DRAFT_416816 [Absidia repens]|uniref:RING-type domain-containing protein n=1 Tax=Absidia repens TaxID=90262 RepID=A0A1X2IF06_9FUNG|nr:hypothetical protein BCR42DRAFT_416816 [Absidia repens]